MRIETNPADILDDINDRKKHTREIYERFYEFIELYRTNTAKNIIENIRQADAPDTQSAEKKRQERINELISIIAHLRQKLFAAGGKDASLEAQISMLQSELVMLMIAV